MLPILRLHQKKLMMILQTLYLLNRSLKGIITLECLGEEK